MKMFCHLFRKLDQMMAGHVINQKEKFFNSIYGYDDIKKLLVRCIFAEEPIHVLLTGPPGGCKTMFLLEMAKGLYKTYFMDATSASGPGMIDYLFENDIKYLLVDEIDKLQRKDQSVLLNLIENNVLVETKVRKTRKKEMKVSVFATCNDIAKISNALKSRFIVLQLEEYKYDQFLGIAKRLLPKIYGMNEVLSTMIADAIWNSGSKDVRDLLKVGKLARSPEDVEWVVTTLQRYNTRSNLT
jgi:replication-associated recombination protein RarA